MWRIQHRFRFNLVRRVGPDEQFWEGKSGLQGGGSAARFYFLLWLSPAPSPWRRAPGRSSGRCAEGTFHGEPGEPNHKTSANPKPGSVWTEQNRRPSSHLQHGRGQQAPGEELQEDHHHRMGHSGPGPLQLRREPHQNHSEPVRTTQNHRSGSEPSKSNFDPNRKDSQEMEELIHLVVSLRTEKSGNFQLNVFIAWRAASLKINSVNNKSLIITPANKQINAPWTKS